MILVLLENMPYKRFSLTLCLLHTHAHTVENHLQNISHILCCDFIMLVIQAGKLLPCAVSNNWKKILGASQKQDYLRAFVFL